MNGNDVRVIDCSGREPQAGQFRIAGLAGADIVPIAKPVRDDAVLCFAAEVGNIALHVFVVLSDVPKVTVMLVSDPGIEHNGASPFWRVTKRLGENYVFR